MNNMNSFLDALNKNLFPSGNLNIESIAHETKKSYEFQNKKDKNKEEIVVSGNDTQGAVDFKLEEPQHKKITRNERRLQERNEKKGKKDKLKEIKKTKEIEKKKEELEKIKLKVKDEIKSSQFSPDDVKRLEKILFNNLKET
jgi:hypothetical protein